MIQNIKARVMYMYTVATNTKGERGGDRNRTVVAREHEERGNQKLDLPHDAIVIQHHLLRLPHRSQGTHGFGRAK